MIGREHFGLQTENQIFPRHAILTKLYSHLWGIIESTKSNATPIKMTNIPLFVQICLIYPII